MQKNPIWLLLCLISLLFPVFAAADSAASSPLVREIKTLEFKNPNGPVRLHKGLVVFSHADAGGNAHNAVVVDPVDGSSRNVVEGLPGAKFVTENERYRVYSSRGNSDYPLVVQDKSHKAQVMTSLRQHIQWGDIAGDRLIIAQGGGAYNTSISMAVYSLPALTLQKSGEIAGGNETILWKNRIVSIGERLGIYDLDLRKTALVDMPPRDADTRGTCIAGPLRISGEKAIVGANCGQLVVVDLPSARVERVIRAGFAAQSFDIADGIIFTATPDASEAEMRAIDLASGVELARIPLDTDFVAMGGAHLLGMRKGENFSDPLRFTLYKVDFAAIKSETARAGRLKAACEAAPRSLNKSGDLHAAIEACEKSGIKGFIDNANLNPELVSVIGDYAIRLARTHSRYNEGIALLERLNAMQPDANFAAELTAARRKAAYLNTDSKDVPAPMPEPAGVKQVAFDPGAFFQPIAFEDDRIYIARWLCDGKPRGYPGVVLEVLDRKTLNSIKQIEVAACDFGHQDTIETIVPVPGYIVIGLRFQLPKPGRPNVAVVDANSLAVTKKAVLNGEVARLRRWQDKLLACAGGAKPNYRFDPQSASLVPASNAESGACVQGQTAGLWSSVPSMSAVATARYHMYQTPGSLEAAYRITSTRGGANWPAKLQPRHYLEIFPATDRDALVMTYANGEFKRFTLFDIAAQSETFLFELDPGGRTVTGAVWRNFLFVSLGRDLLVYDLEKGTTVSYEKNLIRESTGERSGIKRLLVDQDRLIVAATEAGSSRVIDLHAYVAALPKKDFFAPQSK
jgi:hypothetical protein